MPFPLWTIRDHPAVDRRVIHVDPTFHACFDMARAQGIRHVSADAHKHDVLWKCAPLKLTAVVALPYCSPSYTKGEYTLKFLPIKLATKP